MKNQYNTLVYLNCYVNKNLLFTIKFVKDILYLRFKSVTLGNLKSLQLC